MAASDISGPDVAEIEASVLTPPPSSETNKATEHERQLASKASLAFFIKKNYLEALSCLENLHSVRPTDIRVSCNLSLLEFLVRGSGGFHALAKLQSDLKSSCLNIALTGTEEDLEETEYPALVFNLALCAYFHKHFLIAEKLCEQVYNAMSLESSPLTTASPSVTAVPSPASLQFKHRHLLPLMIAIALALQKPNQALVYLSEADTLAEQLEDSASYQTKSLMLRAHALLLSRQHKIFKRDLKPTGLGPEQLTAYEFYRSNLEYLKSNHRKAIKLLGLAMQQHQQSEVSVSSSVYMESLYTNNLGCLHLMLGKPNLAVFYLHQASRQHANHVAALRLKPDGPASPLRKDAALMAKQPEIHHNLGLALLHAGHMEQAFQVLSTCLPALNGDPSLWLHLAECCIAANQHLYSQKIKNIFSSGFADNLGHQANSFKKNSELTIKSVGSGAHTKFILKPTQLPKTDKPDDSTPQLTMSYAAKCLRNALAISGNLNSDGKPALSSPKGNGNGSSGHSSAQASPTKSAASVPKVFLLRAAILVKSAYVALCLSDPVSALDYSRKLLDLNANGILPNGYKVLAHTYAAEALIWLSRISEATDHLDTANVVDVSFSDLGGDSTSNEANIAASKKSTDSATAAKSVFLYNMIVAFALRGELDKADLWLDKLWYDNDDQDRFGFQFKILALRIYVQLAKGNLDKCRELALKHISIIQR